jgi:Na+/melibiose symporter-like transporter
MSGIRIMEINKKDFIKHYLIAMFVVPLFVILLFIIVVTVELIVSITLNYLTDFTIPENSNFLLQAHLVVFDIVYILLLTHYFKKLLKKMDNNNIFHVGLLAFVMCFTYAVLSLFDDNALTYILYFICSVSCAFLLAIYRHQKSDGVKT